MFEVASKKLGLGKVVLGKNKDGDDIESQLNKEEIERLLKYGAYDLFKDGNKVNRNDLCFRSKQHSKEEDFDFDKIMESSSTVTYGANQYEKSLSSFSKAVFRNEEEMKVDLHDKDFWDKVLPSFKTVGKLNETLNAPEALDTPEKRQQYVKDLQTLIQETKIQEETLDSFDPSTELISLVRRSKSCKFFDASEVKQLDELLQIVEKPRLRKRSGKIKHFSNKDYFAKEDVQDEDYDDFKESQEESDDDDELPDVVDEDVLDKKKRKKSGLGIPDGLLPKRPKVASQFYSNVVKPVIPPGLIPQQQSAVNPHPQPSSFASTDLLAIAQAYGASPQLIKQLLASSTAAASREFSIL